MKLRFSWLLPCSLVALLAGALVLYRSLASGGTEAGSSPGPGDTAMRSLQGPDRPSGERVQATTTRTLEVLVQEREHAQARPLERGTLIVDGSPEFGFPILSGEVTLPLDVPGEDWRGVRIRDAEGDELWFRADGDAAPGDRIVSYAYPGYFVVAEREDPEAWRMSKDLGGTLDGLYPWAPQRLQRMSIQGAGPAYIPELAAPHDLYFLRQAGSVWTRVAAGDHAAGDSIRLKTEAAGNVFFEGPDPQPDGLRLVVRNDQGLVMKPLLSEVQGFTLQGWSPGSYRAFCSGTTLDSEADAVTEITPFEVVAGATARVQLEAASRYVEGAEAPGRLQGTLRFDGWDLIEPWNEEVGFALRVQRLGQPSIEFDLLRGQRKNIPVFRMVEVLGPWTSDPLWRWETGEVPPGSYRLLVEPLCWRVDVLVEAGQTTVADIEVPELARTRIELDVEVSESGRKPTVTWRSTADEDPSSPSGVLSVRMEDASTLQVISPPGPCTLGVYWKMPTPRFQSLDLHPGWNTLVLDLQEGSVAELRVVGEDGQPIAVPDPSFWEGVSIVDGDGTVLQVLPMSILEAGQELGWCGAKVSFEAAGNFILSGGGFGPTERTIELVADGRTLVRVEQR